MKVANIGRIAAAGADTFVAGSAIFGAADYAATIAAMRREVAAARARAPRSRTRRRLDPQAVLLCSRPPKTASPENRVMTWTVHKFGGTSVADASCIRRVAGIIGGQRRGNLAVVVSAMKGVTDDCSGSSRRRRSASPSRRRSKALRARHEKANVELLGAAGAKPIMARVRPGSRGHRQHPEGAVARARGVAPQPRSRLGLRRDLVGAADRRVLQAGVRQDARRRCS